MKTSRTLIVVLSVLVLWLGYLQLSGTKKPEGGPPKLLWQTNAVEFWRTNAIALWHTNTIELWRTNIVVQNFTNLVVKEVPAQLSSKAKEAAAAGFKYLNAPSSAKGSDALYRAGPFSVDVVINNAGDKSLIADDPGTVKKNLEAVLQARSIPVAESSPHRLSFTITPVFRSGLPRVALLALRLELREKVALQRQGDIISCDGVVWSTAGSRLVRTFDVAKELKAASQEQLDKFCDDYLKTKETEQDMKSRIPTVPNDLLPGT